MRAWMTTVRPIDAVPWSENDPQEDELGIARLTMDTNMAGMAFPQDYPFHFRRSVLQSTGAYERHWLRFTRLTWLHDGVGRSRLLIKNSAHTARVAMVLRQFPKARFVLMRREREDSIRSLVQVKQALVNLIKNAIQAMTQGGSLTLTTIAEADGVADERDQELGLARPALALGGVLALDADRRGVGPGDDGPGVRFGRDAGWPWTWPVREKSRWFYETKLLHRCLLYTSPSPRDQRGSRMPSSA